MELHGTFDDIEYRYSILISRKNSEVIEETIDSTSFVVNLYVDECFHKVITSCNDLIFKGKKFWDQSRWIILRINSKSDLVNTKNCWPLDKVNDIILYTNNANSMTRIKLYQ